MSRELRITFVCCLMAFLAYCTIPQNVNGDDVIYIDFEGFGELTPISTQYCADYGISFSILNNPTAHPIIALQGCPIRAYDGGTQCIQHDTPSVSNGGIAALTDPLVGGTSTPNYAVAQSIVMTFRPPITSISLNVIDIEGRNVVTVRALSGPTVVMTTSKSGSDNDTGNRVPTLFALSGANIDRVEVLVPPIMGYAIDDITFSRPSCPAGDVDGNCQLDENDVPAFINVLLGVDTECTHVAAADMDGSGAVNGKDIQPFIQHLLE